MIYTECAPLLAPHVVVVPFCWFPPTDLVLQRVDSRLGGEEREEGVRVGQEEESVREGGSGLLGHPLLNSLFLPLFFSLFFFCIIGTFEVDL